MLQIDRWLGVPSCALATGLRYLTDPWRAESRPVRSILFIKLAEQGSTVLAHLALKKAVERVGRENVYMAVFEDNRFIVDVLGVIPRENVITVCSDSFLGLVRSSIGALAGLRRKGIDAVVDLEFFARSSALFAYFSGAKIRVGFHAFFGEGPYRGNLMTHRVRYNPHLHTTPTFALLVDALDVQPESFPRFDILPPRSDDALPYFAPAAEEVQVVERLIEGYTGLATVPPIILLNANASDLLPLRRWSRDSYVELGRRLLARFPDVRIVFTGAREEAPAVDALVGQVGTSRCFSLAGKTSLRQLLILYGLADVLVTNDSGPAHFASLTPIHTVTLFGPETPLLFSAMTPRNKPIWAGVACSPCVSALNNRQSPCQNNICMQRITVDQVYNAVCESYAERDATAATAVSGVQSKLTSPGVALK